MIFLIDLFVVALGKEFLLLIRLGRFALWYFWGLVSGPSRTCTVIKYFWLVDFFWFLRLFGLKVSFFLLLFLLLLLLLLFNNFFALPAPTSGRFLLFDSDLLLWNNLLALVLLVVWECFVADYQYVIKKYYPVKALMRDCLRGLRNWFLIMFCDVLGPF